MRPYPSPWTVETRELVIGARGRSETPKRPPEVDVNFVQQRDGREPFIGSRRHARNLPERPAGERPDESRLMTAPLARRCRR